MVRLRLLALAALAGLVLVSEGPAARIIGSNQNDVLRGTSTADKIYGKRGNDRLYGRAGNDLLVPGPGADFVSCGRGRARCEEVSD